MRKLFLSFSGLLSLMASQRVTQEDLRESLFFFGCTRDHAMNPGSRGETDERTFSPSRAEVHPLLVQTLLQAEEEDRVRWHNGPQRESPWHLLNELLNVNGYSQLTSLASELGCHYSYPEVKDAVTAQGLALNVVY